MAKDITHFTRFSIEGLNELRAQFKRVGKLPRRVLTNSAKEGMKAPLADAKAGMPVGETGLLKKGLKRVLETPNKRKKAIYRMVWNPKYIDFYLKDSSGAYGGKTPKAYYPHSIEYGFKTKYGYQPGHYVVRDAIEKNEEASMNKIKRILAKGIEDELRKR